MSTPNDELKEQQAQALKAIEQLQRMVLGGQEGATQMAQPVAPAQPRPSLSEPAKLDEPLPVDWSTEGIPAAANGLQILHRATGFALLFTDMTPFPGRGSPDGTAGNERAAIVASLRIDPDSFFRMLCVMNNSWNRYVTQVLKTDAARPRFKLLDAGELQLDQVDPSE